jgi:hypothetical protein
MSMKGVEDMEPSARMTHIFPTWSTTNSLLLSSSGATNATGDTRLSETILRSGVALLLVVGLSFFLQAEAMSNSAKIPDNTEVNFIAESFYCFKIPGREAFVRRLSI